MKNFDINEDPHRRFNPLINEWVLVSPHRAKRPWQGQNEKIHTDQLPQYDPACYLCAGNIRANGETNPKYESSFFFENYFAAVKQEPILFEEDSKPTSAQSFTLLFTYALLAPLFPTKIAERCGILLPEAFILSTSVFISCFISLEIFSPSKI